MFITYTALHLALMPVLARHFPFFERWNYGVNDTLHNAGIQSVGFFVIFSFWWPKS